MKTRAKEATMTDLKRIVAKRSRGSAIHLSDDWRVKGGSEMSWTPIGTALCGVEIQWDMSSRWTVEKALADKRVCKRCAGRADR
jgi:hypothetical protein